MAIWLLSSLVLSACAGAAPLPPAPRAAVSPTEPPSAPQPLAFGWKIPCRVPVEERSEKRDGSARVTYTITARPGADKNIEVVLDNFRFLELNGEDLTSPEQQARLAPVLAMISVMPTLLVTREGRYAGAQGVEAVVKRLLHSRQFSDPKVKAGVEKLMLSPQMQASLVEKTGEYWMLWVGAWVGLSIAPGETRERDGTVEFAEQQLPVHLQYKHHGAAKEGTIRLSLTSTSEGDTAAESMTGFMRWLVQQAVTPEQTARMKEMRADSFRRVVRMEVETDPANLRPRRARLEMVAELSIQGKSIKRQEVREDLFDWTHAEGCR